jgi:hypothetical protein
MAIASLNTSSGKVYTDDSGKVWDTIAYRRLSSGEYLRVMLQRYGNAVMLQFGHAEGDRIVWQWAAPLAPQDSGWLVCDLGSAIAKAAGNTDAVMLQAVSARAQLEGKVVAQAEELKALKDQEGTDAA